MFIEESFPPCIAYVAADGALGAVVILRERSVRPLVALLHQRCVVKGPLRKPLSAASAATRRATRLRSKKRDQRLPKVRIALLRSSGTGDSPLPDKPE